MKREPYRNRQEAGKALAAGLAAYKNVPGVLVLGLPRGGVPVAAEVAHKLNAPLDVLIVRKIGMPRREEFAMGAIAAIGGTIETVRNDYVIEQLREQYWKGDTFGQVEAREREELQRRQEAYRGGLPPIEVAGRTVILVDDGLATGASMRAAIAVVQQEKPARLVVGVPVSSQETASQIRGLVDDLVCPWMPHPFWAVGQAYESFTQTTDAEVQRTLLSRTGVSDD